MCIIRIFQEFIQIAISIVPKPKLMMKIKLQLLSQHICHVRLSVIFIFLRIYFGSISFHSILFHSNNSSSNLFTTNSHHYYYYSNNIETNNSSTKNIATNLLTSEKILSMRMLRTICKIDFILNKIHQFN